jgi:hypothetical protein
LGLSETDQRVMNELRRVGATATDAEKLQIEGLIRSLDRQREAMEANRKAGEFMADSLGNSLIDVVLGAESAEDATKGLLQQFARAALQGALLGSGPLAGLGGGTAILSGLFGLKLANGGEVRGPGTSTSDSIPTLLSDGEHVIRASEARKHRALLVAINEGRVERFADGGIIGNGSAHAGARLRSPNVTIAPSISVTVEGGSRGVDADAEAGRRVAKEVENTMRGLIHDELRSAMRPGNPLTSRAL